jgi:hypothetical protein
MNDAIWELANVSRSAGVCMTGQMIGPGPRIRCLSAPLKLGGALDERMVDFNRVFKRINGVGGQLMYMIRS